LLRVQLWWMRSLSIVREKTVQKLEDLPFNDFFVTIFTRVAGVRLPSLEVTLTLHMLFAGKALDRLLFRILLRLVGG
jgi:hypothetical protein